MEKAHVLSSASRKRIEELKELYPHPRGAVLPALWVAQREKGWISPEVAEEVAELLGIPRAQIEEVLSFYILFHKKPVGKHVIWLCRNISCYLRGYPGIKAYLEELLQIREGETTPDGMFTLLTNECLGACEGAPMLQVDDRYVMNLTREKVAELIAELRRQG
jgi:NADH-quinone oxidoreductase subunit E